MKSEAPGEAMHTKVVDLVDRHHFFEPIPFGRKDQVAHQQRSHALTLPAVRDNYRAITLWVTGSRVIATYSNFR